MSLILLINFIFCDLRMIKKVGYELRSSAEPNPPRMASGPDKYEVYGDFK